MIWGNILHSGSEWLITNPRHGAARQSRHSLMKRSLIRSLPNQAVIQQQTKLIPSRVIRDDYTGVCKEGWLALVGGEGAQISRKEQSSFTPSAKSATNLFESCLMVMTAPSSAAALFCSWWGRSLIILCLVNVAMCNR